MNIVIEIDDKLYKDIQTIGIPIGKIDYVLKAIKNGTPLPKRHGRLIDADSFVQEHPLAFVRDVINDTPTIIEADKEEE